MYKQPSRLNDSVAGSFPVLLCPRQPVKLRSPTVFWKERERLFCFLELSSVS